MGREKVRKLKRRQRRRKKLHKIKERLSMAESQETRKYLVDKIRRISVNPKMDIPEKFHDLIKSN